MAAALQLPFSAGTETSLCLAQQIEKEVNMNKRRYLFYRRGQRLTLGVIETCVECLKVIIYLLILARLMGF